MNPRADSGKSHNVATFAGAVGGSIGFLALLAVSLFISIYRRRTLAARRDRQSRRGHDQHRVGDANYDAESFHTDASEDGPPMQGPAPFVPRYFPGTIIPAAPPPYVAGGSPTEATDSLLRSTSPILPSTSPAPWSNHLNGTAAGRDGSTYADRPPPTPPPIALDDGEYFPPPPPFPIAIASPIPAILANLTSSPLTALSPSATTPSNDANGSTTELNSYSYSASGSPHPSDRTRSHSDARSHASRVSDRPPSFVSVSDRDPASSQRPPISSSSGADRTSLTTQDASRANGTT